MCCVDTSGMNTTTGCGVAASNSVLLAPSRPSTPRANSITATWRPAAGEGVSGSPRVQPKFVFGAPPRRSAPAVAQRSGPAGSRSPAEPCAPPPLLGHNSRHTARPHLHAEADPEVRNHVGPRVARRRDLALDAAAAKAAGHEHAGGGAQLRGGPRGGGVEGRVSDCCQGRSHAARQQKHVPAPGLLAPPTPRHTQPRPLQRAPSRSLNRRPPAGPRPVLYRGRAGRAAAARLRAVRACCQLCSYLSGASCLAPSSRCCASTLVEGGGEAGW
jgi:hypothetical protein